MGSETRTWLVEAMVVLRSPWHASEASRREFFHAIRSIEGDAGRRAEVGWTGDDTAFVAVPYTARSARRAAESLRATIKRRATAGARWRLSTGLEVQVMDVTLVEP